MTALIAATPVVLQMLADRHGHPAALLLDLGAGLGAMATGAETAADAVAPPAPPAHLAQPALSSLPVPLLAALAAAGMPCLYRADRAGEAAATLVQAGWQACDPALVQRIDGPPQLPPAPGAQWLAGEWFMAPPPKPVGAQAASRALALKLVQLVSNDADTHEIEAVLRQDPTLSYHLLKLVNSLAIGTGAGAGRRVTSFSQAILILGRAHLRRWLNLMLFSARAGDHRSPMLLVRVSVRARAMELLAHEAGLNKSQQEMAFMTGMFSLLGVLFGMTLADVLKPLTVSAAIGRALLDYDGELGRLLTVVELAERDDHAALARALAALGVEGEHFNRLMVDAHVWMQSVLPVQAAPAAKAGGRDA
ncbi:hypothetical protein ASF61_03685 [Duganella sp. Leaf126]|uniref:EAL and HDOD domain-containing protein n=1 Tax=Duganella sp. Leaf126 TaxID=1736266 RepID=UPI0007134586|nr:HDOD domain-containing protein [Duganella sp. Leaf126]KQQ39927.1 hypothetical protein ASF61_03685 [Duganella sp. Leaf126]